MPYLIAYLVAGLLICLIHPQLREILFESTKDREQGLPVKSVIFLALIIFTMLLWPVVLIFRRRNSSVEDARLNELKRHLLARGRKITETDGVLMTYRRVVEKQFLKVAKGRREHLPEASLREIALHYVDLWATANEQKMGSAMPLLITEGIKTYQERGLRDLLKEIREEASKV